MIHWYFYLEESIVLQKWVGRFQTGTKAFTYRRPWEIFYNTYMMCMFARKESGVGLSITSPDSWLQHRYKDETLMKKKKKINKL